MIFGREERSSTAPHAPKRCHKPNTKRCAEKDFFAARIGSFLVCDFFLFISLAFENPEEYHPPRFP